MNQMKVWSLTTGWAWYRQVQLVASVSFSKKKCLLFEHDILNTRLNASV